MKAKTILPSLLSLSVALTACKSNSKPTEPKNDSQVAEVVEVSEAIVAEQAAPAEPAAPVAEEAKPQTPALTPEERAKMLGFVQYLPKDTEAFISVPNGTKTVSAFMKTKLWALMRKEMGGPDEINTEVEPAGPAALFAREFTFAYGADTAKQLINLTKAFSYLNREQMKAFVKALSDGVKSGDFSDVEGAFGENFGPEFARDFFGPRGPGLDLVDAAQMPPMYFSFLSSHEKLEENAMQISGVLASVSMMGPMVEPLEVEKNGAKFTGYKISGEEVSKQMTQSRDPMDESLGKEAVDRLIAAVAKKNIVILTGTLGDYVVLFFGPSADAFAFAEKPADSMAADTSAGFFDGFKDKQHIFFGVATNAFLTPFYKSDVGGLREYANGIKEGLEGSDGLGDTRDIQALCDLVVQREKQLYALNKSETLSAVGFFDNGFNLEWAGGADASFTDWNAPTKLAHLGDAPDTALFINSVANQQNAKVARDYLEAIFHTAYAMAAKVAEVGGDKGDIAEFADGFKMFDESFSGPLADIWTTLIDDFGQGVGDESALVLDLKGGFPTAPGLPQALIDKGKFLRASLITPVTDRAKVATSWSKINDSATAILAKISELKGQNIPMQKPLSSEKDGFKTWFISLPFCNDDFLPSVTLDDQWLALSTSKNQALDLLTAAKAGGATGKGVVISANFVPLQEFVKQTLELAKENEESMPLDGDMKEAMEASLEVMEDLDTLDFHMGKENDKLRGSLHLKAR